MTRAIGVCAVCGLWGSLIPAAAGQGREPVDVAATLDRISAYVERYYARAQSLVGQETVTLRPLVPDRRSRRLVYDLRVEWNPSPTDGSSPANVVRHLVTVDGRAPRPGDDPGCMDPKPVSPEPLAMLLAANRHEYTFAAAGTGRIDGRRVVILAFKSVAREPARITWRDECVSVELPGRTRGRVWADARTGEILRFDEGLTGMFEVPVPEKQRRGGGASLLVIEQADTSIRYKPVTFRGPEETLLLPASIETLTVIRNADIPRLLKVQAFANYRRFVTDGRVVQE